MTPLLRRARARLASCARRHDFIVSSWFEPEEGDEWADSGTTFRCTRCGQERDVPSWTNKKDTRYLLSGPTPHPDRPGTKESR